MSPGFWLAALGAYLLGSIPTSLLVARHVAGIDLRTVGSGNLGATNLFRALGWRFAVPVALFDAAKGAVPVLVFAPATGSGTLGALLLGGAAIMGHVFSVFVRFKGGKGVATSAGAVLGLAPLAFLISLGVFALTLRLSGYVSVSSILGAVAFPVAVRLGGPDSPEIFWFGVALAGLIALFHQANLRRIVRGTEPRIGRGGERP